MSKCVNSWLKGLNVTPKIILYFFGSPSGITAMPTHVLFMFTFFLHTFWLVWMHEFKTFTVWPWKNLANADKGEEGRRQIKFVSLVQRKWEKTKQKNIQTILINKQCHTCSKCIILTFISCRPSQVLDFLYFLQSHQNHQ